MPDPRELPRVRRPVVPLVRAGHAVVEELVADRLPGHAAVVGALDQLAEPARRLGCEDPIRLDRRSLDVVDLPAPEEGATDRPSPCACRRTVRMNAPFLRADQYSNSTHGILLPSRSFHRSQ